MALLAQKLRQDAVRLRKLWVLRDRLAQRIDRIVHPSQSTQREGAVEVCNGIVVDEAQRGHSFGKGATRTPHAEECSGKPDSRMRIDRIDLEHFAECLRGS